MAQSTTREARTELVLTVVAIAVGGVVFALTGDFVIGVGVGAATFAIARQGMKVWGHGDDHHVGIPSEEGHERAHR